MSVFSDNLKAAHTAAEKGIKPRTFIEFLGRCYGWLLGQTLGRLLRLVLPKTVTYERRAQLAVFVSILATPVFFVALIGGAIYASIMLFGNWFALPLMALGFSLLLQGWRFSGRIARDDRIGKK